MTILELIRLFPGYHFCLSFWHVLSDGTYFSDLEYSYYGLTNDFEKDMSQYDWLFDFVLRGPCVTSFRVDNTIMSIFIEIEKK